jgi:hypothetical protein
MGGPLKKQVAFRLEGTEITFDDAQLLSLDAVWRAAGSPPQKHPHWYAHDPQTGNFVRALFDSLSAGSKKDKSYSSFMYLDKQGRYWAHWKVVVDYAARINQRFKLAVYEAVKEWVEEKRNPGLKVERAIQAWQEMDKSAEWIDERLQLVRQRVSLTSTMQSLGATKRGFAVVTEIGNCAVVGMTAKQIQVARQPKGGRTRDGLNAYELVGLRLFEASTEQAIVNHGAVGDDRQIEQAMAVGDIVKGAMNQIKKVVGQKG